MSSDMTSPFISRPFQGGSQIQEKPTKKSSLKHSDHEGHSKKNTFRNIFRRSTEPIETPVPNRSSLRFFTSYNFKNLNALKEGLESLSTPEILLVILEDKNYFNALSPEQKNKLIEFLLSDNNEIIDDVDPLHIFKKFFTPDHETPTIINFYKNADAPLRKKILENVSPSTIFQFLEFSKIKEVSFAINKATNYDHAEAIFNFVNPDVKRKLLSFYEMDNQKFTNNLKRYIQESPFKIALAFKEKWISDGTYIDFIKETAIFSPQKFNTKSSNLPLTLSTFLESPHWIQIIDILETDSLQFLRRENYLTAVMESLAIGEMSLSQFKNYINKKKTAPWLHHQKEFLIQIYSSKLHQEESNKNFAILENKINRLQKQVTKLAATVSLNTQSPQLDDLLVE